MDWLAEILVTVQGANWQRADPKRRGDPPKRIERPTVKKTVAPKMSINELAARRAAFDDELARRRAARQAKRARRA